MGADLPLGSLSLLSPCCCWAAANCHSPSHLFLALPDLKGGEAGVEMALHALRDRRLGLVLERQLGEVGVEETQIRRDRRKRLHVV